MVIYAYVVHGKKGKIFTWGWSDWSVVLSGRCKPLKSAFHWMSLDEECLVTFEMRID